jgi:hypothetical protein
LEEDDEPLELDEPDPPSDFDEDPDDDELELELVDESDEVLLDPLPPLPDAAVLVADDPERLSVL